MNQLTSLQQSDPTQFKHVMQQISETFADAAQNASAEDATPLERPSGQVRKGRSERHGKRPRLVAKATRIAPLAIAHTRRHRKL
jgi:hypothetical protein